MDSRRRSHSLDVNMLHDEKSWKTPLIQVTQVIHPDDQDHDLHVMSPRHFSRGNIPTIGIDNLSFVPEEDDFDKESDGCFYACELGDVHTPLPKAPLGLANRRGSNSHLFTPESNRVVSTGMIGSGLLERRRHSAGQTLADKSSLAVPSIKHDDDDDSDDVIDNGIALRDLDGDVQRPLLTSGAGLETSNNISPLCQA
ncbi:hypothetical protein ACF0H5_015308 [Mactra antiquata]